MAVYRVVFVNSRQEFPMCFSVNGALLRKYAGTTHRSLRAAMDEAEAGAQNGWHAFVVRRTKNRQGWTEHRYFPDIYEEPYIEV